MRARGLAEVEADRRWETAYASQRTAETPADLQAALAKSPRARRAFEALGKSDRYALILRVITARTAKVREARLQRIVLELRAS